MGVRGSIDGLDVLRSARRPSAHGGRALLSTFIGGWLLGSRWGNWGFGGVAPDTASFFSSLVLYGVRVSVRGDVIPSMSPLLHCKKTVRPLYYLGPSSARSVIARFWIEKPPSAV